MRNPIETETHRQCCWTYCRKMVKKKQSEVILLETASKFGMSIASLCPKHSRQARENSK